MVTIYTSESCPKCKILKEKLKSKNIEYVECNNVNLMLSKGISSVPYLEDNDILMDFVKANEWVNSK